MQSQITQPIGAGTQEQTDLGLAKAIDRLHRIAHQKQAAPERTLGIGFPTGGEALQQGELGVGGVLEFIHQQVTDAVIQSQCQFARVVGVTQGNDGLLRHFGEIGLTVPGKGQP